MISITVSMPVFISGKITGDNNYKEKFKMAENYLLEKGHSVMNPARLIGEGFDHEDYIHICKAMIDVCGSVAVLHDADESEGSRLEQEYAIEKDKILVKFDDVLYEDALDQLIDLKIEKQNDMKDQEPDSVYVHDYMALEWAIRKLKR